MAKVKRDGDVKNHEEVSSEDSAGVEFTKVDLAGLILAACGLGWQLVSLRFC